MLNRGRSLELSSIHLMPLFPILNPSLQKTCPGDFLVCPFQRKSPLLPKVGGGLVILICTLGQGFGLSDGLKVRCNCILSLVLHYQPWKWNLIIPDQFLMYKMIWLRFKGRHNWNQVNDTCSFFSSFVLRFDFFFFRSSIEEKVDYFCKLYKCMCVLCR